MLVIKPLARPEATPTPPPFRALRASKRVRQQGVARLVGNIQERDLQILLDLYDKKLLTTHQITDIYFDSSRRTRRRLLQLYRYGLLDRFRPRSESGSAPDHYLLAKGGAEIVSAYLGEELVRTYDKELITKLAYSPRLNHLVAINTFYSRLAWACRQHPDHWLDWWGENRTRTSWTGIVIPDGFGQVGSPGLSRSVFLEMDLGTEPLNRLRTKLTGYAMAADIDHHPDLLLFCFPSLARETNARGFLHPVGITIATTWVDLHFSDALDEIWLPLENGARYSLLDLPVETRTASESNGLNGGSS